MARAAAVQKQEQLEGMKDVKIEVLSRLVGEWVSATMEKAEATKLADEKHESLLLQMQEHKIDVYRDPDTGITVSVGEKFKIKVEKPRQAGTKNGAAKLAADEGDASD